MQPRSRRRRLTRGVRASGCSVIGRPEIDAAATSQECVSSYACVLRYAHEHDQAYMLENTPEIRKDLYSVCVCVACVRRCVRVCVFARLRVCLQPCLQGEVEAEPLAAGLARLSGPNLQRRV